MLKKIYSKKGQISLEFSLLILAVIVGASLVGYHMLISAKEVKATNIDVINKTSTITINTLSKVS